jgi:hypothetical protein
MQGIGALPACLPWWVAVAAAIVTPVQGQSLTGRVVDQATGLPVPEAPIAVVDSTGARVAVAYSDSLGWFAISLEGSGTYRVEVGQLGYVPAVLPRLAVPASDTVDLRVALPPSPIQIAGVEAIVDSRAPARRAVTAGVTLGPTEIDALLPAGDMIRLIGALPTAGLRVFERQREPGSPIFDLCVEGTRQRSPSEPGCRWVAVYVDGARMVDPQEGLRLLSPSEILSLEFLPPSVAGARWGTGSQNGVLLITTRR